MIVIDKSIFLIFLWLLIFYLILIFLILIWFPNLILITFSIPNAIILGLYFSSLFVVRCCYSSCFHVFLLGGACSFYHAFVVSINWFVFVVILCILCINYLLGHCVHPVPSWAINKFLQLKKNSKGIKFESLIIDHMRYPYSDLLVYNYMLS
jgi:hypothetical protein